MASFIRMMRGADIDEDDTEAQVFEKLLKMPLAQQALTEALRSGMPAKPATAANTIQPNQKVMERLVECMIAMNRSRESSRTIQSRLRSAQKELRSTKDQCLEFEQELIKAKTQLAMDAEDKENLKQSNRRLRRLSMGMGAVAAAPVAPLTPVSTASTPVAPRVDPALLRANERLRKTLQTLADHGAQLFKSTELLRKELSNINKSYLDKQEDGKKKLADSEKIIDAYKAKQKYQIAELDKSTALCTRLKEKYLGTVEQNKRMVLSMKKLSDAWISTSAELKRGEWINEQRLSKVRSLQAKHGELVQGHKRLGENLGQSIETWKERFESESGHRKRAESEIQVWRSKPLNTVDLGPIKEKLGTLYTRLSESHKQINETRQLTTYLASKYAEKYSDHRGKAKETISALRASHHEKMEAMKRFIRNMEIERDQTKLELEAEKAQVRRLSAGENNFRKSFGEKDAQLLQHKVALRDLINRYKHTNSELEVAREELAEIKRRDIAREAKRVTSLRIKNKRLAVKFGEIMASLARIRECQSAARARTLEWSKNQVQTSKIQRGELKDSHAMCTHLSSNLDRLKFATINMMTTFKMTQYHQSERISFITNLSRGKILALSDQLHQATMENQELQDSLRVSVEKMRSAQVAQAESLRRREFRQSLEVNEAGAQVARLKKATFLMSQRMATDVKTLKEYQAKLIECRDHYKELARVQRDRVSRMSARLHHSHEHIKELKGLLVKFAVTYKARQVENQVASTNLAQVKQSRNRLSTLLSLQVVPILQAIMKSCRVTETIDKATDLLRSTKDELSLARQDLTIQEARCHHQNIKIQELEMATKDNRQKYEQVLEEAADGKQSASKEKLRETLDRLNGVNAKIKTMQSNLSDNILPSINARNITTAGQMSMLAKLQDSIMSMRSESEKTRNQLFEALEKEKLESSQKDRRIEELSVSLMERTRQYEKIVSESTLQLKESNSKIALMKTQMEKMIPSIEHDKSVMTSLVQQMSLLLQKLLRDQTESRRFTEKLSIELVHQRARAGHLKQKVRDRSEDVRKSLTEADELKMELFGTVSQLKDKLDKVQMSHMAVRAELEGRLENEQKRNEKSNELLKNVKSKCSSMIKAQQEVCIRLAEEHEASRSRKIQLDAQLRGTISRLAANVQTFMASQKQTVRTAEGHYQSKIDVGSERITVLKDELCVLREQLGERVPEEQYQKLRDTVAKMAEKIRDQMDIIESDKVKLKTVSITAARAVEQSRAYREESLRVLDKFEQIKSAIAARNLRVESGMSTALEESQRSQAELKEHLGSLACKFEAQKTEIAVLKERLAFAEAMPADDHREETERVREQLNVALDRIHKTTLQQKQFKIVLTALSAKIAKTSAEKKAIGNMLSALSASMDKARKIMDESHQMTDSMALHGKLERSDLLAEIVGLQDDNRRIRAELDKAGQQVTIPVRTAPADRLMIGEARHVLECLLAAYKGKCSQLGKLRDEQERIRELVPQMVSFTKQQLTISCTRQAAIIEHAQLVQKPSSTSNEPLYLDPQSSAVRMIIEDLADELAETQEELRRALELCRVKLVEDMSSRKVQRNIAEQEFDGLCRLNEIERSRSTVPYRS